MRVQEVRWDRVALKQLGDYSYFCGSGNENHELTLQGGHLKITAVGPLAVVFFNYPFKFCSKLYYA
jgi:hypothetical protein